MAGLYNSMQTWQEENNKRFLSISTQRDGDKICCMALTNPSEVVITGLSGWQADVSVNGSLYVTID